MGDEHGVQSDAMSNRANDAALDDLRRRIRKPPFDVVIAESNTLVAEGFQALMDKWDDFTVVEIVSEGSGLLRALAEHPDAICVIGSRLLDKEATLDIIRKATAQNKDARIVFLASSYDTRSVYEVLDAGASGYAIMDNIDANHLRGILWGAVSGEVVVGGNSRPYYHESAQNTLSGNRDPRGIAQAESLSKRECEVLMLLRDGLSNAEIGEKTYLSEASVKKVISRIMTKINVSNRVQAAVFAERYLSE